VWGLGYSHFLIILISLPNKNPKGISIWRPKMIRILSEYVKEFLLMATVRSTSNSMAEIAGE